MRLARSTPLASRHPHRYGEPMRTVTMVATVLLLHAVSVSAQTDHARPPQHPAPSQTDARPNATAPAHLVGNWVSTPDRISLTTAFDESVWGKNATSVRTVTLNVLASGKATLTVTRKVLSLSLIHISEP